MYHILLMGHFACSSTACSKKPKSQIVEKVESVTWDTFHFDKICIRVGNTVEAYGGFNVRYCDFVATLILLF